MVMHYGYGGLGFLGALVLGAIVVVPFWRICVRLGYAGPLSLLVLVPLANVVFLYFLAFAEWPSNSGRASSA